MDQWLPRARSRRALTTTGREGTVWGDRNVLHVDCGSSYTGVYAGQNSLNYILKMGVFYQSEFYLDEVYFF